MNKANSKIRYKRGYYDVFVKTCGKYPSNTAVTLYENNEYKSYTYSELYGVCEYLTQILRHFQCNMGLIGLVTNRNIIIPCVIAAAHKCCNSFMFLDPFQDIDSIAIEMQFNLIITIFPEGTTTSVISKKPDATISLFGLLLALYNWAPCQTHRNLGLSYVAMTSGSTGESKKVQVPMPCIQPNITDLTKMFHITPMDVIYFSTPLTFDPSMVEILLACMNGASLLIAPEEAEILFPENKIHRMHAVTVWQTTPSRFFQLTDASIKTILSAVSPLKILALGGEPLKGVNRLKEMKDRNNKTRIFTLYGVTEMSCWATAAELELDKISSDRDIPLGDCLSETQVVVQPDPNTENKSGKIILVSKTRNCVLMNQDYLFDEKTSLKFVDTGDTGEVRNGTIYYRGRKDDVIKRFGYKINLQLIESTVMHCPRISTCSCIWLPKPMLLVVYFCSETFSSQDLSDFLKCKLDDKHWPDKIIRVNNIPTNAHGKITKKFVTKMFDEKIQSQGILNSLKASFLSELKSHLGRDITYDGIKNEDFFSIGGTSFLAIMLCNKLSQSNANFGKTLLPHLLSPRKTIEESLEITEKKLFSEVESEKTEKVTDLTSVEAERKRLKRPASSRSSSRRDLSVTELTKKSTVIPQSPLDLVVLWTYNTNKCVDASPTLLRTAMNLFVCVGSHSGRVVAIDAFTGIVQGLIYIKARVEAAVFCYDKDPENQPCGIVGAYDGTIVCFIIETGEERWRTNIGCIIKSKATVCNGSVYVAAYDGYIRTLDLMTGAVKSKIMISEQPISADLVLAKNEYILTGALSGVCASIHAPSSAVAWRSTQNSPVFASPALYGEDKYVVFAEVKGEITCRTVEKGIMIWRYEGAKGNIFSSFYIKQLGKISWQIVFGCHDNNVYSILLKNFQPVLHWKSKVSSSVYSTPCCLNDDALMLAASTDGKLHIMNVEDGKILFQFSLPQDTYSSPAVYQDYIFIGCRNDNLYSLRCTLH